MVEHIKSPTRVPAAGEPPKTIDEFIGRVNSGDTAVSIARMVSPEGWTEPGQTPEFDEYTVVLRGALRVETRDGELIVREGEALVARAGEWVRYGSPEPGGAEYVAVCLPAFLFELAHRDS